MPNADEMNDLEKIRSESSQPLTRAELERAERMFGQDLSYCALRGIALAERFGAEWYDGRRYYANGCRPSAADIARVESLQARADYYGFLMECLP